MMTDKLKTTQKALNEHFFFAHTELDDRHIKCTVSDGKRRESFFIPTNTSIEQATGQVLLG